jgi:hypothetical protein
MAWLCYDSGCKIPRKKCAKSQDQQGSAKVKTRSCHLDVRFEEP